MADGYVESSRSSELIDALIDLHVLCLNGEGFMLRLSPSTLGRDVRKMVSERLPAKKGAKLAIYHLTTPLILAKSLRSRAFQGRLRDCHVLMFQQTYMLRGVTSKDSKSLTKSLHWTGYQR